MASEAGLMPIKLPFAGRRDEQYPKDLWTQCPDCQEMLYNKTLDKGLRVCPRCGHHFRLRVDARLALLLDRDTFQEQDAGLESVDMLAFVDQKPYPERLAAARASTGVSATLPCGARPRSGARASRSASWTLPSWAARWARSWARRSRAPRSTHLPSGCH